MIFLRQEIMKNKDIHEVFHKLVGVSSSGC